MLISLGTRGLQNPGVPPGFELEPGEVQARRRLDSKEALGPF